MGVCKENLSAGKWLACLLVLLFSGALHAGKVTYVYTDPQGTPLAEADDNGNIIATYDYAPYGQPVTSMSGSPNGPGYTGHVNDPETGLVYMQARYYDPGVGRFLSVDPVGPSPGNVFHFNRYDYADNNPIIYIDPNGMKVVLIENRNAPHANKHSMAKLWAQLKVDPIAGPLANSLEQSSEMNVVMPNPFRAGVTHVIPNDPSSATIGKDGKPSGGSGTVIQISLKPESVLMEKDGTQKMTNVPLAEKAVHEFKHAQLDNSGTSSPDGLKDPETGNPAVEQPPIDEENSWRKSQDLPERRTIYQ